MYLPIILTEIQNNSKRQYLLLHAMKEIITSMSEKEESIELLKVGLVKTFESYFYFHLCFLWQSHTKEQVYLDGLKWKDLVVVGGGR